MSDNETMCSFCGRVKSEVRFIIKGKIEPFKYICDICLVEATQLVNEDKEDDDVPQ